MNKKKTLFGSLSLLITALIWGAAFGAQSKGLDYIGPFTFNGFRALIAVIALGLVLLFIWLKNHKNKDFKLWKNKKALIGSIFCGVCLFFGTTTQQIALGMTSVGKSGFISALYVIIVPILGLFFKKKVSMKLWICVVIAVTGLYLLCVKENFTIELGDLLLMLSAFGFASQIMIVDHINKDINSCLLSIIQFSVVAFLSLPVIIFFEEPTISGTISAMPYLLFAGVLSSGVAYTLQIIGQVNTPPTLASLILSLESVFAFLTGLIFFDETHHLPEFIGCALILASIIISQVEFKKKTV
ncbi:MAG: DMT family transporter [Bacilli bacterium]|nr:DMT family transporter [Bacilli bacterium]